MCSWRPRGRCWAKETAQVKACSCKYKERQEREGGALGLTAVQGLVSYTEGLYLGEIKSF